MQPTIIYIAGLYHSGSTLLDRILTTSEKSIGLGEIYKYITDGPEQFCSCGKRINDCKFWSKFSNNKIGRNQTEEIIDNYYEEIINKVEDTFPSIEYLIDSSKCHPFSEDYSYKNFKGLIYHTKKNPQRLKVINLYRDPRGWVNSIQKREERFQRNSLSKVIFSSNIIRSARWIQWHIMNKRIRKFLKQNNLDFINISYERLCFDTEETIKEINKFSGIEIKIDKSLELKTVNSHICVGNPSRLINDKKSHIKYDAKWFQLNNIIDALMYKIFYQEIRKLVYKKN